MLKPCQLSGRFIIEDLPIGQETQMGKERAKRVKLDRREQIRIERIEFDREKKRFDFQLNRAL